MKAFIALMVFVIIPAICTADVIVILYHKGNSAPKIACAYDSKQIQDAINFLPYNYSHWKISSAYKVYNDSSLSAWTGRIGLTAKDILSGVYGDSLHATNPDSVSAYVSRWAK